MVTVETAIALGSAVFVVLALILAVLVAGAKAEVCQAARDTVRAYSIGLSQAPELNAGRGVMVEAARSGSWVTATARAPSLRVGPWDAPQLSCEVTGVAEPFRWGDGN